MNYHCYTPFEGDVCPVCGSRKVRPVEREDLCLVREGDAISAGLLCEVLKDEGIPFLQQSQIGAAMAVLIGRQAERFNVLVPYGRFDEAREIADALFSAPAEDEIPDGGDEPYDGEYEEEDDED